MSPSKNNWPDPFWEKVDKSGNCWIWTGAVDPKTGYGKLSYPPRTRRTARAHRISWHMYTGIPLEEAVGLDVCHSCDNRRCVNPTHLFLGTRSENMQDASSKGRIYKSKLKGSSHPRAKLTEEAVIEIRRSPAEIADLAKKFSSTYSAVWQAKTGRSWKHLPMEGT